LRQHRDVGVEAPEVVVEEVVAMDAAVIRQRLGDLRLGFGDDVLPDLAVGQLLLGLERSVGIDRVAATDEESGVSLRIAS